MKKFKNSKLWIKVILVVAILVRIWLITGSNWYVNIDSYYDSHLEINSAVNIISGNWMGAYSKFTLCKNPAYPLFVALLYILHIPYSYGLGLFILLTTIMFVKAIKPVVKNEVMLLIIFVLILYNPAGFYHEAYYHYRNVLVPWAVLGSISSVVAIYFRKDQPLKKWIPWSILGMIFVGFFWLLREDSIWFLPFLIVAFIITIIPFILSWIQKRLKSKELVSSISLALLPCLGIVIGSLVVSAINYKCYGIFATNDRTQTSSSKVLGLLISIDDGSSLDKDVWVSDKAIKLAKKESPTFNSLKLGAFKGWPKYGDYSIWALRDCLTDSGYYQDAKSTEKIYSKIAKELETAFDKGKLKKKKALQLSNTSGVYTPKEMINTLLIGIESMKNHIEYKHVTARLEKILSSKNESDILLYEKTLNINLIRTDNELDKMDADAIMRMQNQNHIRDLRYNMILVNIIVLLYKYTGWCLFIIGFIGYLYLLFSILKKKKLKYKWEVFWVMTGTILITYLNAYLVGLWGVGFQLTADNGLFQAYSTAEFLLIGIFELLGLSYFVRLVKEQIKRIRK